MENRIGTRRENCCNQGNVENNWILHNHCPDIVNAYQVQLQGDSGETVANNANVIFDTTILNATFDNAITYNSATGVFTINERGKYLVTWWVNVDGAEEATRIIFSAELNSNSVVADSPSGLVTLHLNGQALFNVTTTPVTLSLVNRTGNPVFYGVNSVQADLIIVKL